jgi:Cof subfamily protein (haloacid dehalogenase superfamily)
MAYKLMAADYDLTLTRSDRTVSEHTRQTIRKVFDAGKFVTLSSGRIGSSAVAAKELFVGDVPFIMGNGALLQSAATGEILSEHTMEAENALKIFSWCRRRAGAMVVYSRGGVYADRINATTRYYAKAASAEPQLLTAPDAVAGEGVYKILLLGLPLPVRRAYRRLLDAPPCPLSTFTSSPEILEIVAPGVDKGFGLAKAAEILHIPIEETIAIGDGENDIPMLRRAGLGIAMANASDKVKAAADVVAPSCDEDGAAWAMEKFLLVNL